ncbi:ABC transporter ATP-binding protein [Neobacillus mesonae]|nr:ABC transporter ATP-binding protein [Neobacillus mesonae]
MILKLNEVSKSYGSENVIQPMTFEVKQGERICILGPSGCGKSTLLQMVAGLQRIDSGSVEIDGAKVEGGKHYTPPERRPINMVFQDYALWPHMTVAQNIEYGMKRRKLGSSERKQNLEMLQALMRLEGMMNRLPSQLSGGQQQRVGIARALATEPKLLLMDEPLSNLDVKLRTDMRGELAKLLGELSTATLYVTHDRMEAFTIADRILVLREGQIDQFDEPKRLFERPASPWVAQLMGYHNRISARMIHNDNSAADIAGTTIRGEYTGVGRDGSGKEAVVMIHPEHIKVGELEVNKDQNLLEVTIVQSIYEGTRWRIIAETKDQQAVHFFHSESILGNLNIFIGFSMRHTMLYEEKSD